MRRSTSAIALALLALAAPIEGQEFPSFRASGGLLENLPQVSSLWNRSKSEGAQPVDRVSEDPANIDVAASAGARLTGQIAPIEANEPVRVAQAESDSPPADDGEELPQVPEVIVEEDEPETVPEPIADDFSDDFFDDQQPDPFDLPFSYPSLRQQVFDAGDGILRSETSIFDSPRALGIVTETDIATRAPTDIADALEFETGVLIQRTGRGQASPFIRGLTGQQVLILVDGVRMNNATFRAGPNQYFNLVDPGIVERIEVLRGPGSVLWGSDAIGGVINIVTKSADAVTYNYVDGTSTQRFSSADLGYYGRLNVEGSVERAGVFAGGGYGNFNDLDTGGDLGRQPATSYRYYSGDIKFDYLVNRFSKLTFDYQHFEQNDVFRSDRFPADRETLFDPQQRNLAYLRYEYANSCSVIDHVTFTMSFHRMEEERIDTRPIGAATSDVNNFIDEQSGANLVFGTDLDRYGRLTYGMDWYHDDIDSDRFTIDRTSGTPTILPNPGPTQFPDDSHYTRTGGFVQWDFDLTDRLTAISGIRYEWVEAAGTVSAGTATGELDAEYEGLIGNVGLTYAMNPNWKLVGSISEGFRAPNLDDLTANNSNLFMGTQIPNPDVSAEEPIVYEIGTKVDTDRIHAQLFYYWNDLNNNLLRREVEGPEFVLQIENRDAYIHGLEFSGEYLFERGWSTYGNFWYTYGKDRELDEPLSRIPPAQGILGLRWRDRCGRQWFDVWGWFVARQDRLSGRDLADTIRIPEGGTPGYATMNFSYGWLVAPRHRLGVTLENIFDKQYRVHGSGADGPGINAILTWQIIR